MTSGLRALRAETVAWTITATFALAGLFTGGGGLLIAPLVALGGLIAFALAPGRMVVVARAPAAWALAAFIGWALASVLWSPVRETDNILKLGLGAPLYAAFVAACAALAPLAKLRVQATLAFAAASAAAIFVFEAATGGALSATHHVGHRTQDQIWYSLGHGASVYVVMLPPLLVALWPGGVVARITAGVLVAVAAFASVFFTITANLLALIAAGIGMAAALARPRLAVRAVGWLTAASVAFAPVLLPWLARLPGAVRAHTPLSWEMRLEVWRHAGAEIAARPWFGHGFDASRAFEAQAEVRGLVFDAIPLHPHNIGLHAWLETGAVGAGLFTLAIVVGAERVARAPGLTRGQAAAAVGVAAALAAMGLVSYGLWQEWWLAAAFLAAGGCLTLAARARGARS